MAVTKSAVGTVHVIAECEQCDWREEDYRTAIYKGRKHAEETGHTVHVDRGQVWKYNPR